MSTTRSQMEKRLARLLSTTPPPTQRPEAQLKVDLVYLDQETQDRLAASRHE
jgi:hypothetical protein